MTFSEVTALKQWGALRAASCMCCSSGFPFRRLASFFLVSGLHVSTQHHSGFLFLLLSHCVASALSCFDAGGETAGPSLGTHILHMNRKGVNCLAVGKYVVLRLCFIPCYSILDKPMEFQAVPCSRKLNLTLLFSCLVFSCLFFSSKFSLCGPGWLESC